MNKQLQIIGIAGTNGSGKDTLGQILANSYGYLFLSVTDILRAELSRRQVVEVTRENLRSLSAQWRREAGNLAVLVDKAVEENEKSPDKHTAIAIASIRHPGEADRVHELGGKMVWVDANQKVRYERVRVNAASRQRKGEDNKTFEQFKEEEAAEMTKQPGSDDANLNMLAVKEQCDVFIYNNENDLNKLQIAIENSIPRALLDKYAGL